MDTRLGSHPDEVGLAMTALGSVSATRADPTMYPSNGALLASFALLSAWISLAAFEQAGPRGIHSGVSMVKTDFQI
jgi:hypothetical protein